MFLQLVKKIEVDFNVTFHPFLVFEMCVPPKVVIVQLEEYFFEEPNLHIYALTCDLHSSLQATLILWYLSFCNVSYIYII